MKAAKEQAAAAETTGGASSVTAEAVAAAVTGRHPTLNTKPLFKLMVEKKASDLFFTSNAPIKIKIEGQILPVARSTPAPAAAPGCPGVASAGQAARGGGRSVAGANNPPPRARNPLPAPVRALLTRHVPCLHG